MNLLLRLFLWAVESTKRIPPRKPRRRLFWGIALLVAILALLFHGLLLEKLVRVALESFGKSAGLVIEAGRIRARIGAPLVFEKLRIRAEDPGTSRTAAQFERLEIRPNWPTAMFGTTGRLLNSVTVSDGWAIVDLRGEGRPPGAAPMKRLDETSKKRQAGTVLWFLPKRFSFGDLGMEVIWDDGAFSVSDATANFDEAALGQFTASGMEFKMAGIRQIFASQRAATAWKNGEAFLADMTLRNGMTVESVSVQLARPGGVGVDASASVFGGFLRGGALFAEWRGEPGVDAAVWASGFDFAELSKFFGLERKAGGYLKEGRFTFRGNPERPLDAEASLRCSIGDFRLGERGWETMEAGVSLINRRLSLGELRLKQKENSVSANGEIALGGDWKDMAASPFLLNVSASILDMSSLGELLGPPFDELSGRMSVSAALSGRARKVDGFLSVEASRVGIRGRTIESGKLDVLFAKGEAKVERLEVWSSGDYVTGQGAVGLEGPHIYTGRLQGRVQDLGDYAWLPDAPLPASGGGLQFRWQGDGTWNAHSGDFNLSLEKLITDWTPEGLTGRFSGTYSPGNVYFGGFELEKGNARLQMKATVAESGVRLEDVSLRSSRKELASGEVYLPLNPYKLFAGQGVLDSIVPEKSVHARFESSGELSLEDLFALVGQDPRVRGSVRAAVNASGNPEALIWNGELRGRDIVMVGGAAPALNFQLSASAADGAAYVQGQATAKGLPPMTLQLQAPFGIGTSADGKRFLMNPSGPLQGTVEIPRTELTLFRPFLPDVKEVKGSLTASAVLSGTVEAPRVNGQFAIRDGALGFSAPIPSIDKLTASLQFTGDRLVVEGFTGEIGAGPFQLTGTVGYADFQNPVYDLKFQGEQLLLHRSTDLRLRTNVNLTASGSNAGGRLEGGLALSDGRLFQRLEITPLIAPSPAQAARPFSPPVVAGLVPEPFARWTANVTITNASPFEMIGNVASGEIQPNLRVVGTLGNPIPVGEVKLKGARAFLPFTTMEIPEGRVEFVESNPWMPILDVRGHAEVLEYEIDLHASGPLSEGRLRLRSDPPLSQESIILLLTTGLVPGFHAGSGFGEAAVGQGGMLLLRTLLRQFDMRGVDTESLLNRLQVSAVPPPLPGGSAGLRARLRVTGGLSLMAEQDDLGFYNTGVTYRFRFR